MGWPKRCPASVRIWLGLLALALLFMWVIPAASAYRFHGVPWPGGVVPYYTEAKDQSWAVGQAVAAWNHSGARVRFVAVSPSAARLVIREVPQRTYCSEGQATVGDVRGAEVLIFPARGRTHACNPYWAARVMTHELGHVLGLKHEDRVCATMNAYGNMRGGSECPTELWAWRCRLLEMDDIEGVVAIYGGKPNPPRANAYCPLYTAMSAPTHASKRIVGTVLRLRFVRPSPPTIPSFVIPSPWPRKEGFVVSRPYSTCREAASQLPPTHPWYFWDVRVGATQDFDVPRDVSSGCYAVWALDQLGRPSAHAALISVG